MPPAPPALHLDPGWIPPTIIAATTALASSPGALRGVPMIDKPQIVQTAAQLTAFIRLTIPRSKIQEVMGPSIGEVMAAVASQGLAPTGPVFAHHLKMSPDTFDFEVGVPVAKKISAAGRVK